MINILIDMARVGGQEVALPFGDLVNQDGLPLDSRYHEKATTRVPGTVSQARGIRSQLWVARVSATVASFVAKARKIIAANSDCR